MNVRLEPQQAPPPTTVVMELTMNEARKLYALAYRTDFDAAAAAIRTYRADAEQFLNSIGVAMRAAGVREWV